MAHHAADDCINPPVLELINTKSDLCNTDASNPHDNFPINKRGELFSSYLISSKIFFHYTILHFCILFFVDISIIGF